MCQADGLFGRAYSHRIPLVKLMCVSPKRWLEWRWPPGWGCATLRESRAAWPATPTPAPPPRPIPGRCSTRGGSACCTRRSISTSTRPKLRSTNPLERVNREIGRRTDVVGIFPNDRALLRLAASVVIEQNDEWLVGRGYLSAESISLALAGADDHTDKDIKEEVAQLQAA